MSKNGVREFLSDQMIREEGRRTKTSLKIIKRQSWQCWQSNDAMVFAKQTIRNIYKYVVGHLQVSQNLEAKAYS